MKRLLYIVIALLSPLLMAQSTVVCTTSSPGTVIGSCASGAADPLSLANIAGTTSVCSVGAPGTADSVCLESNSLTGEGSSADASETILAFGNATADQTLTCTGAASSLGCVVASPAVPTNGTTAGNALALTASPAIPNAGAGTDGAAAGGSVTITSGAAARDTSGNANGGNIILATGAGIGTGVAGQILIPSGAAATPGIAFSSQSGTGFFFPGTTQTTWSSNGTGTVQFSADGLHLGSTGQIAFTASGANAALDTGLSRAAAGVLKTNNGSTAIGALLTAISVETVATTKAPALTESAELYTNKADVDGQAITLPNDPTVGVCFEFALTSTDSSGAFVIAPSAGETLSDAGTSCATVFSATAAGATARICAVSGGSGGAWFVMSKNGTWTCTP